MKGYKEILISFLIGFLTIGPFAYMVAKFKSKDRFTEITEPTQLQGRSEDPAISLNWGLSQIQAPDAWRINQGSRDIIVAVIDTGCDFHHPDLQNNIWNNPGESGLDENGNPKSTNGIDDDGNGFVDDVHGWDFVSNSSGIMDDHGHGTHIAGIIGGKSLGVAPRVSLMILKYFDEHTTGPENLNNTVEAIRYAVKMGARIINYSGGGILKSAEEEAALRWASDRGVLVVAAAGNEGLNSDFFHFYPADYDLPNIISVGAVDRTGHLIQVSNFGKSTVDVAAPGKNIYSTLPGGSYGYMTGTSQATAYVTGLAALILAQNPTYDNPQLVIRHILATSRPIAQLRGLTRTEALINAPSALQGLSRSIALESEVH